MFASTFLVSAGVSSLEERLRLLPNAPQMAPMGESPISVLPTAMLQSQRQSLESPTTGSRTGSHRGDDVEKDVISTVGHALSIKEERNIGVTFFVKKSTGLTRSLAAHDDLLTLLDGPYPNTSTASILRTDRLLIISGGIGITGMLPWINAHPNVKLCWSVKKSADCLVQALDVPIQGVADKEIRIGSRANIHSLLNSEIEAG